MWDITGHQDVWKKVDGITEPSWTSYSDETAVCVSGGEREEKRDDNMTTLLDTILTDGSNVLVDTTKKGRQDQGCEQPLKRIQLTLLADVYIVGGYSLYLKYYVEEGTYVLIKRSGRTSSSLYLEVRTTTA